jgi:Uma2 family endonuclease
VGVVDSGMSHGTALDAAREPEMSLAEWAGLPEDDEGELVDGRLVEEEVSDATHEDTVSWMNALIRGWVVPRGGFVLGSDAKFAVRPRRGRKPDLTVFLPGGAKPPRRGLIRVPPDIAVEVVSPTPKDVRRDRVEKLDEYAAFGVRFYWILDPRARTLEMFELGPKGLYERTMGAVGGTIERVPGCEGLTIDLDALWAELDRLGPEEEEE